MMNGVERADLQAESSHITTYRLEQLTSYSNLLQLSCDLERVAAAVLSEKCSSHVSSGPAIFHSYAFSGTVDASFTSK